MELLIQIFNILLLLVGSAFLIVILIAIIQVPFKQHKQNKVKKELFNAFGNLSKELEKAIKEQEKEDKTKTKKTNKDTKTKENK